LRGYRKDHGIPFSARSHSALSPKHRHQQELRLRAANQQVARGQHVIETIDARRQALRAEQARALGWE